MIFSFFACAAQEIQAEDLVFCFHCNADINYDGEKIQCAFSRDAPGRASVQFLSGNLNGLTYDWSGENFSISYSGISAKSEECVLPDTSFAVILLQILDYSEKSETLVKTHGDEVSGSMNGVDFTMTADRTTGQIQTICVPQRNLEVQLHDFTQ
ncbi:hypothetical protein [Caproiciproducens faecalis]|uniref:Uncharacterized protein n=1 Tax=Caproiciproducens faecalis TaxID=2820301 RepID=A0ABS7DQZ1_9FIRM|nr:hypothetical protein [Caproiciproducens faecalis]MBW7573708.1 hypothetical protein [Caproiciproducens faecalis]